MSQVVSSGWCLEKILVLTDSGHIAAKSRKVLSRLGIARIMCITMPGRLWPIGYNVKEARDRIRARRSCSDGLFSHAIWSRALFDMEADLRFFWQRRRSQERAELLVNITQGAIVEKQGYQFRRGASGWRARGL